jgi:hypothetical protein
MRQVASSPAVNIMTWNNQKIRKFQTAKQTIRNQCIHGNGQQTVGTAVKAQNIESGEPQR